MRAEKESAAKEAAAESEAQAVGEELSAVKGDVDWLRDAMAKDAYDKWHLDGSGRGRPLLYAEAF